MKTIEELERVLLEERLLSEEQLAQAFEKARLAEKSLCKILIEDGYLSEAQMTKVLSEKMRVPYVDLEKYTLDSRVFELIPEKLAHKWNLLPLFMIENVLTVAMGDPFDLVALDEITKVTGRRVEPVMASAERIRSSIRQWYGVGDDRKDLIQELAAELTKDESRLISNISDEQALRALRNRAEEPQIVQLVNELVVRAVLEGASSIHVEPGAAETSVRFRIDGALFRRCTVRQKDAAAVTARIKLIAGLTLTVQSKPQVGLSRLRLRNQLVDLAVSSVPTLEGESVVLRIRNRGKQVHALDEIGLSKESLAALLEVGKRRSGLILVSGPQGSGKSTTAYSLIKKLVSPEKVIVTIEENTEHQMDGLIQCQVDATTGKSSSAVLNSALFQDADVIFVDQIKDFETCGLVLQGALSGHLILSTVVANNAFEAIRILYDLGISAGLLEAALKCSICQRLVRRICANCKTEYSPPEKTLAQFGLRAGTKLFRGEGCPHCNQTGYRGVTGIFEVVPVEGELRKAVSRFTAEEDVMEVAWSRGIKSLLDDGLSKAAAGITTLEEIRRVLGPESVETSGQDSSRYPGPKPLLIRP